MKISVDSALNISIYLTPDERTKFGDEFDAARVQREQSGLIELFGAKRIARHEKNTAMLKKTSSSETHYFKIPQPLHKLQFPGPNRAIEWQAQVLVKGRILFEVPQQFFHGVNPAGPRKSPTPHKTLINGEYKEVEQAIKKINRLVDHQMLELRVDSAGKLIALAKVRIGL